MSHLIVGLLGLLVLRRVHRHTKPWPKDVESKYGRMKATWKPHPATVVKAERWLV